MTENTSRLSTALADRYQIERRLGEGGMATVYLAEDIKHKRKVAVKVLRPELAAVLGGERFVQEITTTANLQHPHILPLFDSGTADGFLFYVMPFIDGETLRDKLDRETQLGVDEAVKITTEVADALNYAHEQGVIHRDIKPENILLANGRPMVADFGIALAVSAAAGGRMTETGLSLGTPHYMSPEQATAEKELTNRADIYSLGSVLYEMLTGSPPHVGATAQQIIMKIVTEEAQSVTAVRRSVPPQVAEAIAVSLEKLPADRFATAAEFAAALAGAPTARTTARAVASREPSRGPWRGIALLAGVVALLAVAIAAWGWLRPDAAQPVFRVAMSFLEGEQLYPGSTRRLALARDGSRMVYIGPDSAGTQLWVREMNSLNARPLPGTNGALAPFFSPDGTRIAFFTDDPGDLRVVSLAGEPPLTLVRDGASPWGGDWGADGYIYFSDRRTRVSRVSENGGAVTTLSAPGAGDNAVEHDWPQLLPGGERVLIQIWHSTIGDAELGLLDIAKGELTPLTEIQAVFGRYVATGHLLYSTFNGALQVVPFDAVRGEVTGAPMALAEQVQVDAFSGSAQFDVSDTGVLAYMPGGPGGQQVVWVDRVGAKTPVDSSWTGKFGTVALSPDGGRLAVSVISEDGEHIWVMRLPSGPLSRLTNVGTGNLRPAWAPDGRQVSFVSNRTGDQRQVYVQRADGSAEAEPFAVDPRQVDEVEWAPDGNSFIIRVGSTGGVRDLWLGFPGDTTRQPLLTGAGDDFAPAISPNGRWFAYVSAESGSDEVFVRSMDHPGVGRTQVSVNGGKEPRWAHSGRELFYRNRHGEMIAVDVTTGSEFTAGTPEVLFGVPNMAVDPFHHAYAVARDDQSFVMIDLAADASPELVIVTNWFEELLGGR